MGVIPPISIQAFPLVATLRRTLYLYGTRRIILIGILQPWCGVIPPHPTMLSAGVIPPVRNRNFPLVVTLQRIRRMHGAMRYFLFATLQQRQGVIPLCRQMLSTGVIPPARPRKFPSVVTLQCIRRMHGTNPYILIATLQQRQGVIPLCRQTLSTGVSPPARFPRLPLVVTRPRLLRAHGIQTDIAIGTLQLRQGVIPPCRDQRLRAPIISITKITIARNGTTLHGLV